ncbi:MAG: histidine phosphatase family protein, partial [Deltaproteobacteria bacterium]|nr:histidine phosphatase family protein [Deltaproteobacteria bacterium]
MPVTLFLTRHGVSEHNTHTDYYMGRSPASRLVEKGRQQARSLGRRLARQGGLRHIIASSLPRTMETAELIARETGVSRVEGMDAFWELNKGEWEGRMRRDGVPVETAAALRNDPYGFRYPGGESYQDVLARVAPALESWRERAGGETTLLVLHGDVIRVVLYHLLRFPSENIRDPVIFPCSLSEFLYDQGHYRLVRYNDDSHLIQEDL